MADYNLDALPPFLKPKLRLFMSVDITGSTQFKQMLLHKNNSPHKEVDPSDGMPSEPWLSPILEFYEQISVIFGDTWKVISRHAANDPHGWDCGDRPSVWKAVGDELIFTKALTDHRQAYVCVAAWLETIQEYRKRIKEHSSSLDLKCAAWIAGFPINNAEVILDHQATGGLATSDDGDYIFGNLARLCSAESAPLTTSGSVNGKGIRDFIGPSIDTGFRVASVASPRKFVLSADLAFILAHVSGNLPTSSKFPELRFYYDGRKDLKGVTNGTPYPIFWINAAVMPNPLMDIEDQIENRKPTPASEVKTFCELFLEKNKDTHVMRPFILGDRDDFFKRVPSRHVEKLGTLAKYWESENERRISERQAQLEPEDNGTFAEISNPQSSLDELTSQLVDGAAVFPSSAATDTGQTAH